MVHANFEIEKELKETFNLHYNPDFFVSKERALDVARLSVKPAFVVTDGIYGYFLVYAKDAKTLVEHGFSVVRI